jgi:hypothetical protein
MYLSLADSTLLPVIELAKGALEWKLPSMQECGVPLAIASDSEKVIVAYDSNKIAIFDSINMKLHEWTRRNLDKMPHNFLYRYNRIVGLTIVSDSKVVLYTNYTFAVLDINAPLPKEVDVIQNHPSKSIKERHLTAIGWFDNLKLSQQKYLGREPQTAEPGQSTKNLAINNKYKGVLAMEWDNGNLLVVENTWQKAVSQFQAGALITKKFKK